MTWCPTPPQQLVQASKIHNTSATSFVIRRDSRDSLFAATKGSDNSLSVEMAGLGGDTAFVRYIAESGWYFPLKWDMVAVSHARAGGMNKLSWGADAGLRTVLPGRYRHHPGV